MYSASGLLKPRCVSGIISCVVGGDSVEVDSSDALPALDIEVKSFDAFCCLFGHL